MVKTIRRHCIRIAGIVPAMLACLLLLVAAPAHAQEEGVDYIVTSSTSLRPDSDTQSFVVTVRNISGAALTDLEITDTLPSGMVVLSSDAGTGTYNPTTATWTIPHLDEGAAAEIVIVAGREAPPEAGATTPGPSFWPWWLLIGLSVAGFLFLLSAGRLRNRHTSPQPVS